MWRSDYDRPADRHSPTACRWCWAAAATTTPAARPPPPRSPSAPPALRVAGEGELLAQIERLRRKLHAEGLFEPQKRLPRPALPRSIGVVTGEGGKARDDVLAGLRRRGWQGRLVWGFAPCRTAARRPLIARALQDLAAVADVDAIVVARGGGSVMDLMAFSRRDAVPHRRAAAGAGDRLRGPPHRPHADRRRGRRLLLHPHPRRRAGGARPLRRGARPAMRRRRPRCARGRRAVVQRARRLAQLTRAPAEHLARERRRLHQQLRELRAVGGAAREFAGRSCTCHRRPARAAARKAEAAAARPTPSRGAPRPGAALAGAGGPRPRAHARARLRAGRGRRRRAGHLGARRARRGAVSVRFHDDRVRARIEDR